MVLSVDVQIVVGQSLLLALQLVECLLEGLVGFLQLILKGQV